MPFPRKFQHLIQTELEDVVLPDYLWLAYAVCACSPDACGWGGWMIEAAFRRTGERHPTATGDLLLSAVDQQVCPRCGRVTYRTGAVLRMEPSPDQMSPVRERLDYGTRPPEFEQ